MCDFRNFDVRGGQFNGGDRHWRLAFRTLEVLSEMPGHRRCIYIVREGCGGGRTWVEAERRVEAAIFNLSPIGLYFPAHETAHQLHDARTRPAESAYVIGTKNKITRRNRNVTKEENTCYGVYRTIL